VTVRHLLEHRSGLRAFLPLDQLAPDADSARQLVLAEPLRWAPATRVEYSDLNAMLLAWVIEVVSGRPLDVAARELVFGPAGMREAQFRPARSLRPRIAPVGLWRGHPIAGEIHDQNAARLGGVSGHAGLYATGLDLARYAQLWLRGGETPEGRRIFNEATARMFSRPGPGHRALGWEMRDTSATDNTGRFLSPATFGHTGYTGTSLWIDPVQDLFVILLTNRVYAPRHNRSISRLKEIRGAVADAALQTVGVCVATAEVRVRPRGC
jgi:CubicO group peptidase (beta-lactamase class C family)